MIRAIQRQIQFARQTFQNWVREVAGTDSIKWEAHDVQTDLDELRRKVKRLLDSPPQMQTIPPQDATFEGLKARIDALAKRNPEELALAASTTAMIAVEAAHRLKVGSKKNLKAFDLELRKKVAESVNYHLAEVMLKHSVVPLEEIRVAVEACVNQVVAKRLTDLIGTGSITIGAPVNAKAASPFYVEVEGPRHNPMGLA